MSYLTVNVYIVILLWLIIRKGVLDTNNKFGVVAHGYLAAYGGSDSTRNESPLNCFLWLTTGVSGGPRSVLNSTFNGVRNTRR